MKIAFIHYHLKTGGVTTVLKQQIEAIMKRCEVFVITGEPPPSPLPVETGVIPGLDYDKPDQKPYEHAEVAESIIKLIRSKWPNGCDVLHVHNPTLCKNRNFLKILKELQKREIKLLLQIHDFAEDGRPFNYYFDTYVSDCHYGVINSRDYDILLRAGLKKEGLHKIFNTLKPLNLNSKQTEFSLKEYVLYPIRAIRRKNIGEAILLSQFFKNKEKLLITLPPNSPADIISYNGWKKFVKKNDLNIEFEAGLKNNFTELVQSAKFILTTSITEGFGFSFLEPWTAKKILWGRKLPDICQDFEKNGIRMDHLYTHLQVPVAWLGKEKLYEKWYACIVRNCKRFKYTVDENEIKHAFSNITCNETIDFGLLDEGFQKQILDRILTGKNERETLIRLNPFLADPGRVVNKQQLIQDNLKAAVSSYNPEKCSQKLIETYSRVTRNSVSHCIDKKILLSRFFNLEQFSLLKWGVYAE